MVGGGEGSDRVGRLTAWCGGGRGGASAASVPPAGVGLAAPDLVPIVAAAPIAQEERLPTIEIEPSGAVLRIAAGTEAALTTVVGAVWPTASQTRDPAGTGIIGAALPARDAAQRNRPSRSPATSCHQAERSRSAGPSRPHRCHPAA